MIRSREQQRRIAAMATCIRANKDRVGTIQRPAPESYSHRDNVDFLEYLGLDPQQVVGGSVGKASLAFACARIEGALPEARPLLGLHIGNFVGVSLCHFTSFARELNSESTVISIDPNLPHRGVANPIHYVVRCLDRYGLQNNALILTGYSLEKSVSNDGAVFEGYDPAENFTAECGPENQLPQLARLLPGRFDFAFMDGNHERDYLGREIDVVWRLLAPGGLLILDDLNWEELGLLYRGLDEKTFERLGDDGRVGVLRKRPETARAFQ